MASLCGKHIVEALRDCADCPAPGPQLHLQVIDCSHRQPTINTWEHYSHCNFIDPPSHSTKGYRNGVWGNWQGSGAWPISMSGRGSFVSGRCYLLFSHFSVSFVENIQQLHSRFVLYTVRVYRVQSNVCWIFSSVDSLHTSSSPYF